MLIKKMHSYSAFILMCLFSISMQSHAAADIGRAEVIEYVTFKALDGVDKQELAGIAIAVNANLQENYPGFVERTVSLQDDGTWVEVVFWEDMPSAKAALDKFLADPLNKTFLSMVNPDSVVLTYSTLQK